MRRHSPAFRLLGCGDVFSKRTHNSTALLADQTLASGKGFAASRKNFDCRAARVGIDRRGYLEHNYMYVNPAEVRYAQFLSVMVRATRMAPKYIFVTGGVVSSLGKGVAASSIGCL